MLSLFPPCRTTAFIVLLCCCNISLSAQGNRDCRDFVILCGQDEVQFTPGQSGMDDFQNPYNQTGCLRDENSTAWYYFEAIPSTPSGAILEMSIVADEDRTDYDFAIWGPVSSDSNVNCDSLGAPIRCNYAQKTGPTGLAGMGGRDSEPPNGSTFSNALLLEPGVGYYLLIDNYRSDQKSFTFTFERGGEYLNCNLNAETITLGCGDSFVDAGGTSANYANNTPYDYYICPTDPATPVALTFSAFDTEPMTASGCPDLMVIYDGQNSTAPIIGDDICGNSVPGPFTATNPSGCLFITFSSNNVRTFPGWEATITCPPVCPPGCTETETLPCDDLDPCTRNDVVVLDCDGSTCIPCMGIETPCDVADLRVEPCDDGNPNTTRDSLFVRDCDGVICVECTGRLLDCEEDATERAPCDDGNACTLLDSLTRFVLLPSSICEPCAGTPQDCDSGAPTLQRPCDDGNLNTINDQQVILLCDGSICQPCTGEPVDCASSPSSPRPCDDGDPCTENDVEIVLNANGTICVPCTGAQLSCATDGATDVVACDDGDVNTINDRQVILLCDGSICQPCTGEPVDCASSPSNPRPCDDGDPCTENDVEIVLNANGTICVPCTGAPLSCATDGATDVVACDDGDVNTINDRQVILLCDGSICQPCTGEPVDCASSPSNPRPCDDGDPCTENDVEIVLNANGTICVPCTGAPLSCATDGATDVVACDDGDVNTINDRQVILLCDGSICQPCAGESVDCASNPSSPRPCDDGDPCTENDVEIVLNANGTICVPCIGTPLGCATDGATDVVACDDGDVNTINDRQVILLCDGSICQPCAGESVDCASNPSSPRPCDDGNPCTVNDTETALDANGTVCIPCAGTPIDCATEGVTTIVRFCDDGIANTVDDVETVLFCSGEVCIPCAGLPTSCSDDPTTTRACDDGDRCTIDDIEVVLASDGSICVPCAGIPQDCANGAATTQPCDDGNANTVDDTQTILDCDGSICVPCLGTPTTCENDPTTTRPCDDGLPCTIDDVEVVLNSDGTVCEPCSGTPQDCANGATTFRPCDDGNILTADDVEVVLDCDGTVCTPCAGIEFCPAWVAVTEIVSSFAGGGVSCTGGRDASAAVTSFDSPFTPYRYVWSTGDTTSRIDDLAAGVYAVTVTDAAGCPAIDSITVTEPDSLTLNLQLSPVSCFGADDGSIEVRGVTGGTAPFIYQYGEGRSTRPGPLTMIGPGTYRLSVTDANGCQSPTEVTIEEPDELYIDLGADTLIRLGDSLLITPTTNAGVVDSFMWRGVDCKGCPVVTIQPFRTGRVSVTIADEFGCLAEDERSVQVDERPLVYVPNAFSPNGDKVNDVIFPFADESVTQVTLFQVYDRWGECLWVAENFAPNDPTFGWDGTLAGQPLNPGVFVYSIEVLKIDGAQASFGGDFVLMR